MRQRMVLVFDRSGFVVSISHSEGTNIDSNSKTKYLVFHFQMGDKVFYL